MPLTDLQRNVIAVLRPFRTSVRYVAGGAALNQNWPRLSDDMDIFHDRRAALPAGVEVELDALRQSGFAVDVTTEDEWMVEALLRKYGFETRVQWIDEPETSRRFFMAIEDEELGFRLHQADVAINKVLCAARRRQAARDAVDLVSIVERYCALGPLIWAACGKDEQVTPPAMVQDVRSIVFGYSDDEIRTVRMEDGRNINRARVRDVLGPALERANAYCLDEAPADYFGHLLVNGEEVPVEADEEAIATGEVTPLPLKDYTVLPQLA